LFPFGLWHALPTASGREWLSSKPDFRQDGAKQHEGPEMEFLNVIAAAVAAQGRKLIILSDFSKLCLAHRSLTLSAVMLLPPLE